MNFGDDEMKIDSFLNQMRKRNENIVFAGDGKTFNAQQTPSSSLHQYLFFVDTWKMFKLFSREHANRDSLFVNDFYEGDRNVTDSLKQELKRKDWKLLILREYTTNTKISTSISLSKIS